MTSTEKINALTKRRLEASWPLVEKTEHWVSFGGRGGIRKDLFGFGDFIAIRGDTALIVQSTSWENVPARVRKIRSLPAHAIWLRSPHRRIEVWGWKKGANGRYEVRTEEVV